MACQEDQLELLNEYSITRIAKEKNLPNIIHLKSSIQGDDYIGLVFKRLKIDFRTFLRNYRDSYLLPKILE